MKTGWAVAGWIVFGIVCGLLGAGLLFWVSSPPRGKPVELLPAPTQSPLQVHVTGAVSLPGVYALPRGSRVMDAIEAAGGMQPWADGQALNLAAPLEDGAQIRVAVIPPTPAPVQEGTPGATPDARHSADLAPTQTSSFTGPVNINTAGIDELDTLPGIGPATAQKIISYRESHGPFASSEAILDVPGIGPATYDQIRDLITVGH